YATVCRLRTYHEHGTCLLQVQQSCADGPLWPSARPQLFVRDRNVGAFLILWDARAARPVHGQILARTRTSAAGHRALHFQDCARKHFRGAGCTAFRLSHLRLLFWPSLSDADFGRSACRPRARSTPDRHPRRRTDGCRTFRDGIRAAFFVRTRASHSRQRGLQAQYLYAGRRALCARRSSPGSRILDILRGYQSWRVPRTTHLRHARRRAWLALRIYSRRIRHDGRACHLSAGKDAFGHRKSPAASVDKNGWRSIFALLLLFLPVSLFWATYEQQGNTIALWADQFTDRRFFGAEIPVTWFQAFNPFMIFAFTPFVVAFWR